MRPQGARIGRGLPLGSLVFGNVGDATGDGLVARGPLAAVADIFELDDRACFRVVRR